MLLNFPIGLPLFVKNQPNMPSHHERPPASENRRNCSGMGKFKDGGGRKHPDPDRCGDQVTGGVQLCLQQHRPEYQAGIGAVPARIGDRINVLRGQYPQHWGGGEQ